MPPGGDGSRMQPGHPNHANIAAKDLIKATLSDRIQRGSVGAGWPSFNDALLTLSGISLPLITYYQGEEKEFIHYNNDKMRIFNDFHSQGAL